MTTINPSSQQLQFVLSNPSHPGNIGAAARALKTMCFQRLTLVNPAQFPDAVATARAAGADEILDNACVYPTLDEAIAGSHLIIGASARERNPKLATWTPRHMAGQIQQAISQGQQVAILFGNEQFGLSNEELRHCQAQVVIPSNPEYSSLNLAAAVQILAYECQLAINEPVDATSHQLEPAPHEQVIGMINHFYRLFEMLGIVNPQRPETKRQKLMTWFNRTQASCAEIDLMRGFLKAVESRLPPKED